MNTPTKMPTDEARARVFQSDYHVTFLSRFMQEMAWAKGRGKLSERDLTDALATSLPKLRSTYLQPDGVEPFRAQRDAAVRRKAKTDANGVASALQGLNAEGKPATRSSTDCLIEALGMLRSNFHKSLPALSGFSFCLPML